jgi:uncharacterized protein
VYHFPCMDTREQAERVGFLPLRPTDPAEPVPTVTGLWARVQGLAATSGCPKRTAAAFALGVFLSFSPLLGFQVVLAVGLALALRLSKTALFLGLWANMPWIMIPWYTATTIAGAFLLRIPVSPHLGAELRTVIEHPFYRSVFWERLFEVAGPFLWAFIIGPTVGALMVGAVAYVALVRVLRARKSAGERAIGSAP